MWKADYVVWLKKIPNVLDNTNTTGWSVAFKGEHTFEVTKHSLSYVSLVQSQRIHTSTIGGIQIVWFE